MFKHYFHHLLLDSWRSALRVLTTSTWASRLSNRHWVFKLLYEIREIFILCHLAVCFCPILSNFLTTNVHLSAGTRLKPLGFALINTQLVHQVNWLTNKSVPSKQVGIFTKRCSKSRGDCGPALFHGDIKVMRTSQGHKWDNGRLYLDQVDSRCLVKNGNERWPSEANIYSLILLQVCLNIKHCDNIYG